MHEWNILLVNHIPNKILEFYLNTLIHHDDKLFKQLTLDEFTIFTGREQSFTPGGEPPLVPITHPGASIRD